MKAWMSHAIGDMRLEEIPDPVPGPDEVLIRIRVVEPSVTEAILATGGVTVGYDRVRQRLAEGPAQLFGHEYCAEVIELGSNVTRLKPGQRVADRAFLPCMECGLCRSGRDALCRRGTSVGIGLPGMLAEYGTVPHYALVPVPDELTDYEVAAIQPAAECVAAIDSARVEADDVVAVIGLGPMGIHALQAARTTLARKVIAIDVRPEPLELAGELGADALIDASTVDVVDAVQALTGGIGADVVVEAAGGPPVQGLSGSATVDQAFSIVRDCGRVVVNSLVPGETPLDFVAWRMRSLHLIFPEMAELHHLDATVAMVAQGRLKLDPVISHVVWGIEEVPLAFEITADKRRFGATGPCQVVVATDSVPRDPRVVEGVAS